MSVDSSATRRPTSTGLHVEDLAEVYVLLVRAILEREDHSVGYLPIGKHGINSTAIGRVRQTEIMQLCLDTVFDAGVLPREHTPKEREIRRVELKELADEIMGDLVGMAERSWAGRRIMKGAVAKKLLGCNPDEAWKQDYRDVLNALEKWDKQQQSRNINREGKVMHSSALL